MIAALLTAMQEAARPVQPTKFGLLGEAHLTAWLTDHGCDDIVYAKTLDVDEDGRPFVVETAFGYRPGASARLIVTGINSAPCLVDPFRELNEDGTSLAGLLGELYLHENSPVMVIVHLTAPCLSYTDRGKSSLAELTAIGEAITKNTIKVTRAWTKHQERRIRAHNRAVAWRPARVKKETLKAICWRLMPEAYAKASGSVGMALARQIFYAIRGLAQLGDGDKTLTSTYFTQTLLVDYMEQHPGHGFDVLWDDRGHFMEPHTGEVIGLGTLSVRHYLAGCASIPSTALVIGQLSTDYPTVGPTNRYNNVLICEKEGFNEIFRRAGIDTRYDLSLASSKGMNSTACRTLVEGLPVRFLILHDFDKSGFSIAGTLSRNTRRHQFKQIAEVIDLGIRLEDVIAEHLPSEPVSYTKEPERNMRLNGATKKEIAFLLAAGGRRVELNAFTNDHLITWLEQKLQKHGVKKFIPDEAVLTDAYRRALLIHTINRLLDDAVKDAKKDANAAPVPKSLLQQVRDRLKAHPTTSWDAAVAEIARTADD